MTHTPLTFYEPFERVSNHVIKKPLRKNSIYCIVAGENTSVQERYSTEKHQMKKKIIKISLMHLILKWKITRVNWNTGYIFISIIWNIEQLEVRLYITPNWTPNQSRPISLGSFNYSAVYAKLSSLLIPQTSNLI